MAASLLLGQNAISWKQLKTTAKTPLEKVIVRQIAGANHAILTVNDTAVHTVNAQNGMQMMREAEQ